MEPAPSAPCGLSCLTNPKTAEREDALSLLVDSFKCPLPKRVLGDAAIFEQNEFWRNRYVFKVTRIWISEDQPRATSHVNVISARYSDLQSVVVKESDGSYVSLRCAAARNCINSSVSTIATGFPTAEVRREKSEGDVLVCRLDTANAVKLAIDILIEAATSDAGK
jgi:hypothetical protein